ncbi:helix-turn-helix domain-containing protein [Halobacillus litoralis]|uniref:XRE family transcriptional regulator n=1 Tax=Halobacillus litoralis TaxID=45668 RepID=A0A410MJD0_9BACI|nr:helix-turn-helix transcriptional regulator [Halobacillus litoralis]QAS54786.1 XRE family transcriptional regulator [Halobacillus litoralis]
MIEEFDDIERIEDDHERLIILRKRLGKSQYQFAMDLGVSSSYIGQVENYKFPFTNQLKDRINSYLRQEREIDENDIFINFR